MLTTKARQQIEQLLQYAAAGGNAALVNTHTASIIATDGAPDSTGLVAQLKGIALTRGTVEGLEGVSVGQVGLSYLLVVKAAALGFDSGALRSRIDKACDLLSEMVQRSSARSAAQFKPWMTKK